MKLESKQQILERRKEIEQELVDMLKETDPPSHKATERAGSDFTLDHVRDAIFHEEDNDDMMKVVTMFDRGGDASELSNVLELEPTLGITFLTKFLVVFLRPKYC
jgi:hypothetical protein